MLKNSVKYDLKESGEFVISDYNKAKLFSSFFPGIAGEEGIPMWLFYVNRGQCVCSMGIEGKQKPIMEFLPANRAYQLTSTQGFRTFIKPKNHSVEYYEPFQDDLNGSKLKKSQKMNILPEKLILEEENETLGLKFIVEYFNIPNDNFAGLVRRLRIKNLNDKPFSFEGLDGLPLIIPFGIDNNGLKFMRRLQEAFVEVTNYENDAPLFKGKVEPADRPDVVRIKKGNFYIGFEQNGNSSNIIKPIVDPVNIFGTKADYSYPERFLALAKEELYEGQILENRLPSAMGYFEKTIEPDVEYVYNSIIGHASSADMVNKIIPLITREDYINSKDIENKEVIEVLTQKNFVASSENVLNQYTRQNFLDNTLRGGFPITISKDENPVTLHLYSRKHGDLERDYNDYRLTPTPFSQGNGNYRDVNQNRRCDLFFNPDVQGQNVEHFFNLIQLDGFNPLVIRESYFKVKDEIILDSILKESFTETDLPKVKELVSAKFAPGDVAKFLIDEEIKINNDLGAFIDKILKISEKINDTNYGEGYWTDHWTYNLDLLENFLAVYPEKLSHIMFENKNFTFYDNPHKVVPREDKYVLWEGNPMQLQSVVFDEEKEEFLNRREYAKNVVHTANGKGSVYKTNLLSVMLCLVTNKMASLDSAGVGVEMESDKPNWYDALNGLPGLIGSSISETLEVKRNIQFLLKSFTKLNLKDETYKIFIELKEYMESLTELLSKDSDAFTYWDNSATVKENYRRKTLYGICGVEKEVRISTIVDFLTLCLNKLNEGINKAWNKEENVISTYFINEVKEYSIIKNPNKNGEFETKVNSKGFPCYKVKEFKHRALPLFLEGVVHYLRNKPDAKKAKALAKAVKESGLFDQKLKMYKVNASLKDEPMEIGRARTFSSGWFENESIWLHMEYKYMLELLRNELYDEFYADFKNVFVPFFDANVYGRSVLENSSFIVSSGNPDPSIHGNGFVARLSGATAEFIHILNMMCVGSKPFIKNLKDELVLNLAPKLPSWLFTKEESSHRLKIEDKWQNITLPANSFTFMFLGETLITYKNSKLKNTFGADGVQPVSFKLTDRTGNEKTIEGDCLTGEIACEVRDRKYKMIEIELA